MVDISTGMGSINGKNGGYIRRYAMKGVDVLISLKIWQNYLVLMKYLMGYNGRFRCDLYLKECVY